MNSTRQKKSQNNARNISEMRHKRWWCECFVEGKSVNLQMSTSYSMEILKFYVLFNLIMEYFNKFLLLICSEKKPYIKKEWRTQGNFVKNDEPDVQTFKSRFFLINLSILCLREKKNPINFVHFFLFDDINLFW